MPRSFLVKTADRRRSCETPTHSNIRGDRRHVDIDDYDDHLLLLTTSSLSSSSSSPPAECADAVDGGGGGVWSLGHGAVVVSGGAGLPPAGRESASIAGVGGGAVGGGGGGVDGNSGRRAVAVGSIVEDAVRDVGGDAGPDGDAATTAADLIRCSSAADLIQFALLQRQADTGERAVRQINLPNLLILCVLQIIATVRRSDDSFF